MLPNKDREKKGLRMQLSLEAKGSNKDISSVVIEQ